MPTLVVVALDDDVPRVLSALGIAKPQPAEAGSARAFVAWAGERLVAVISGRDREALAGTTRPLPFYGRYGWVTFEGGRMLARGIDRRP